MHMGLVGCPNLSKSIPQLESEELGVLSIIVLLYTYVMSLQVDMDQDTVFF